MNMKNTRLSISDRANRTLRTEVSDKEFEVVSKLAEDAGQNRGEYIRTAIEYYAGQKIFRPRCAIGHNAGAVKNDD